MSTGALHDADRATTVGRWATTITLLIVAADYLAIATAAAAAAAGAVKRKDARAVVRGVMEVATD